MSVRVRFAPSPTGVLHVGGARTALFNWLFARGQGGSFVLRIEDTDKERSTQEAIDAIYEGMRWLGLDWDEGPDIGGDFGPYLQTEREPIHQRTIDSLAASDMIYPLWLSAEELQEFRTKARESGKPLRYPGRDEAWSMEDVLAARAKGEGPALLLKVPLQGEVAWKDLIKGDIKFDLKDIDDFVIVRGDGTPTYNFAVVLDDADMEITHVLRGDDHVSNTPKQLLLFDMLGKPRPEVGHVPMILGPDGAKLSKRHGATAVGAYKDLGFVPEGMINYLALLGWALDDKTEVFSREDLVKVFSLERVGSTPSIFDQQKLSWMNGVHLRAMTLEQRAALVEAWLVNRGLWPIEGKDQQFLVKLTEAVGDRLKLLPDIEEYGMFALVDDINYDPKAVKKACKGPSVQRVLREASSRLRSLETFDETAIETALDGLAEELGLKAGQVFQPLRVAVTGSTTSPGIHETLALAGKERVLERLERAESVFLEASSAQQ
jgi:glutamyl-tRNA synthetase